MGVEHHRDARLTGADCVDRESEDWVVSIHVRTPHLGRSARTRSARDLGEIGASPRVAGSTPIGRANGRRPAGGAPVSTSKPVTIVSDDQHAQGGERKQPRT